MEPGARRDAGERPLVAVLVAFQFPACFTSNCRGKFVEKGVEKGVEMEAKVGKERVEERHRQMKDWLLLGRRCSDVRAVMRKGFTEAKESNQ